MTLRTLADVEAGFIRELSLSIKAIDTPDMEPLQAIIAEAAYYKAEQRGFEPGHELPDWLAAEEEIRSMIALAQCRDAVHRTPA